VSVPVFTDSSRAYPSVSPKLDGSADVLPATPTVDGGGGVAADLGGVPDLGAAADLGVKRRNIVHVFHLGDITNSNTPAEWQNAADALSLPAGLSRCARWPNRPLRSSPRR
jgi:hypothetical protein